MSEESKQENLTSIAVALGRVEEAVKGIAAQFADFKVDHRSDIKFIWEEVESLRNRVTALENINLERKGGKLSIRTVVEVMVGSATLFLYYKMAKL